MTDTDKDYSPPISPIKTKNIITMYFLISNVDKVYTNYKIVSFAINNLK